MLVNDGRSINGTSHGAPVWPTRGVAGSGLPSLDPGPIEQHANMLMPCIPVQECSVEDAQVGDRQSPAKQNCQNGFAIWGGYFDHPSIWIRNMPERYSQTATIAQFLPTLRRQRAKPALAYEICA